MQIVCLSFVLFLKYKGSLNLKQVITNCRTPNYFDPNPYYIILYLRLNTTEIGLFYEVQYWNEMKHARLHTDGHLDSIKRLMTV